MRLSIKQGSRNLDKAIVRNFVRITLDGDEQTAALMADEELGVVLRCAKDERGHFLVRDGKVHTEIVSGDVQITLRDDAPRFACKAYVALRATERRS